MGICVSVIMPSLNQIEYIEKCIKSVIGQSLRDIEIICIDAGSTDGTLDILKSYASLDSRVRLVTSDIKSYGYQVNLGILSAKGKYIGIVETDDEVSGEMFETLYEKAISIDADFVKADYYGVYNDDFTEKIKEYHIINSSELYNKEICCNDYKEVFLHNISATWSGIYKRSFLIENNIFHNETKGASFQDTGFWFQTYMIAKKVVFIDKPLYRYRIDNPNSSTFNSSKVYCISDEFQFVLNKILNFSDKNNTSDIFTWIFFRKYFRNLERISAEDRCGFLDCFSKDFNKLKELGLLNMSLFSREEEDALCMILSLGSNYMSHYYERRKEFVEELAKNDNIIVYGAGKVGNEIAKEIKKITTIDIKMAVTKLEKSEEGVYELSALVNEKNNTLVIVAILNTSIGDEMEAYAKTLGFDNIKRIKFGMWEF